MTATITWAGGKAAKAKTLLAPLRWPNAAVDRDGDDCIRLYVPEPPSANRWWRKFRNRMVLSEAAQEYKDAMAALLLANRVRPFDGAIRVSMIWWRSRRSGDLDKRVGIALDALQGGAYHNDSQIITIHAHRHESPKSGRFVIEVLQVLDGSDFQSSHPEAAR